MEAFPLQPCVDWWCRLHWPMLVASCSEHGLRLETCAQACGHQVSMALWRLCCNDLTLPITPQATMVKTKTFVEPALRLPSPHSFLETIQRATPSPAPHWPLRTDAKAQDNNGILQHFWAFHSLNHYHGQWCGRSWATSCGGCFETFDVCH